MDSDTVFAKIIRREIPADIVFEDDLCIAFTDVNPQAPVHILVIPKEPIVSMQEIAVEHEAVLGAPARCRPQYRHRRWTSTTAIAVSSIRVLTAARRWTTCTFICSAGDA